MKRWIVLILCVVLALCLAVCGDNRADNSQKHTDNTSAAATELDAEEVLPGVSEEAEAKEAEEGNTGGSHILIAYFSVPEDVDTSGVDAIAGASIVVRDEEVMGNTEYVAKIIQQTIGGDLFRIETVQEYPLDHEPLVDQAAEEQDEDTRPELATYIENPDQYGTILLGYPNWLVYHNLIQCTQA